MSVVSVVKIVDGFEKITTCGISLARYPRSKPNTYTLGFDIISMYC